jgi:hypothetical protein
MEDQCKFFLWEEDEQEAREWHEKYGPPPPTPETPKPIEETTEEVPKSLGNPWTKSISKRKPTARDVPDEDQNGGPSNRGAETAEPLGFEDIDMSRKAIKNTRFCTPGQTDRLKTAEESLPTPDTGGRTLRSGLRMPRGESLPPQLGDAITLQNEETSSLSATVLKLIRAEKVGMNESTEIQIEHEIDTEVALYEQKLRGYEKTNQKLSKRLDEMENMVVLLGGDVAADDSVEFSE